MIVDDFHLYAIERFGNTVISAKRIKRHGIERIENKFKEYGYNVKISKVEDDLYDENWFVRSKTYQRTNKPKHVTYIAELERERNDEVIKETCTSC